MRKLYVPYWLFDCDASADIWFNAEKTRTTREGDWEVQRTEHYLVRRFWEATIRGGYAGHGETYLHKDDVLWWSHGGDLHGDSWERLKFLQQILQRIPAPGLRFSPLSWDEPAGVPDNISAMFPGGKSMYLSYFGLNRPSFREYDFGLESAYRVEVLDTWNMIIDDQGVKKGRFRVELPGREYMAILLTKMD